jgi:hypothetical protein
MPRANWGSTQDLSGLFGGLQNEFENRLESETQRALQRAQSDQDAKDQDAYSKWKNGQMSDEDWLDYIRQRVKDSAGDPAELEKWKDTLRQNEGAISDAQIETQFTLGKVTIGALMAHYQKRMRGVEKNSPAYRDLAQRYAQLSQAGASVGGGYRSGGGGGRRSSGRSSSGGSGGSGGAGTDRMPTTTASGFDITGPDVITPDSVLTGVEDDKDYINDLEADAQRFKSIYTFIKNNPDASTFTDARTGETFPLDKETLLALDKQNLRNNNLRAAYWFSQGNDDKGTAALDDSVYFTSTVMPAHNTMMTDDLRSEFQQGVVDKLMAASLNPDPQARMTEYAKLAKAAADFNKNVYTNTQVVGKTKILKGADAAGVQGMETVTRQSSKAIEEMPDADTRAVDFGFQRALEIMADPSIPPEQVSSELNDIFEKAPKIGKGGTSMSLETLLEGSAGGDGGTNDLPEGYVGPLQTRTQLMGLVNADNPEYDGPRYVFAMQDGQTKVVEAQMTISHQAGGAAVPTLRPKGADENSAVMTRQRIGGQDYTVWAQVEPVDDPAYAVYRLQKDQVIAGKKYDAGELVPSSVISKIGMSSLRTMERNGAVQRESTVEGIQMPDGTTWYRDPEGGLFYRGKLPATTNSDGLTGGLHVNDDGEVDPPNFSSFASGVIAPFDGSISQREMQGWIEQEMLNGHINPEDYRARDAGGQLDDGPLNLGEMYLPLVQAQAQTRAWAASQMTKVKQAGEELDRQQEEARQQKAENWAKTALTAQERMRWKKLGVDPTAFMVDRLREFGSDLGLNLTPTINNDFPTAKMKQERVLDAMNPREDALIARAKRTEFQATEAARPKLAPARIGGRLEGADFAPVKPLVTTPVVLAPPKVDRSYVPPPTRHNVVKGADIVITPKKPKAAAPSQPSGGTAPDVRQKRPSSSSNRRGGFKET